VRESLAEVAFSLRDALAALPGGYTVSLSGAATTTTNTATEYRRDETAPALAQTLVIRSTGAEFRAVLTRSSGAPPVSGTSTLQSAQQQAAIVFSGAALAGEVWTLTLTLTAGGAAVPVVVNHTVDAPAQVAAGIARAITAANSSSFGGAAEGRTLVLVDRSGAAFAAGFAVQVAAPGAGVASNNTVAAPGATVSLSGPVIVGEKWVLDLALGPNAAGVTALTAVGYTVRAGDGLAQIAAGLKKALDDSTDPAKAGISAVANASGLSLTSARLFKAGVNVEPAGSATSVAQNAASVAFGLAGTPKSGDRWIVTVNAAQYGVTVDGTTLAIDKIGRALADAINAGTPNTFTTFFAASTLYVTDRSGAPFTASGLVALQTGALGSITAPAVGSAVSVTLSGDPAAGDTWRLRVNNAYFQVLVGETRIVVTDAQSRVVLGDALSVGGISLVADTASEIALALAAAINTLAGDLVATPLAATLVLTSRSATSLTAGFEIALAGSGTANVVPATGSSVEVSLGGGVVTGDNWRLTLNDDPAQVYQVVVGSTLVLPGGNISVDTLERIAQALVAAVNAAAGDIRATQAGSKVQLGSLSATTFKAGVGKLAGSASLAALNSALLTLSGTPQVGETWTVALNGNTSVAVRYDDAVGTVTNVRSRAQFATALAFKVNATAGFLAVGTTAPDSFVIVSTNGAALAGVTAAVTRPDSVGSINTTTVNARVLNLNGTPINGAVWSVTVDGYNAAVTVGRDQVIIEGRLQVVDSVGAIAARLAQLINANRASTHGAVAAGAQLTIVRHDGNALVVGTPAISNGGTAGTTASLGSASGAWSIGLAGAVLAGEVWNLTFDSITRSLTVGAGMGLADVAAGLATLVNAATAYSAVAEGSMLVLAKNGAAVAAPLLAVTPANRIDTGTVAISITRTTLIGSVAPGDVWTLGLRTWPTGLANPSVIANFSFSANGSTLAGVAAGLAAAINAAAADNFLASADGDDLLVVNRNGATFLTELHAAPAALSVSRDFVVQGPVSSLDRWNVSLTVAGVDTNVSLIGATNLADLASGLAAAINATPGFKATAAGAVITISTEGVNAGRGFTLASSAPTGSIAEAVVTATRELRLWGPLVVGDIWSVNLSVGGVLKTLALPVVSTFEQLMVDLTAAINGLASFDATRDGAVASILGVTSAGADAGRNFALSYSVARGFADTASVAAAGASVSLAQGAPVAGETWQINVPGYSYSHLVSAGQSLTDVIAALAANLNQSSASAAVARGTSIVVAGAGASFVVPARVNAAGAATAIDASTVSIGGVPRVGDTVSVNLGSSTHTVQVRESVPLAEIAAALAARVNAMRNGFVASVDGNALVIADTNSPAAAVNLSFSIASADAIAGSAARTANGATTRFLLSGTARNGETWSVTIGANTHSHVVESRGAIAERLANSINAYAYVVRATVSAAPPQVGQVWTVSVTLGSTVLQVGYAAVAGDGLADVLAGLARALNAVSGTAFSARASGAGLILANATALLPSVGFTRNGSALVPVVSVDGNFAAAFEGDTVVIMRLAGTVAAPTINVAPRNGFTPDALVANNARAITVTPTAAPKAGETWTVNLGSAAYSHVVRASVPVAEIGAGLAASINAANTGFVASVDGASLVLLDANNPASAANLTFSIVGTGSFTKSVSGTTTRFVLGGTAAIGDTFSVAIGANTFIYVVESPTTIATALATGVNAGVGGVYSAFGDGPLLLVLRTDNGAIASPTFTVAPAARITVDSATPTSQLLTFGPLGSAIAGQTWYVLLATTDNVFAYSDQIAAGKGIADINNALAKAINDHAAGGFTAIARNGSAPDTYQLYIIDRAGGAFTASFEIGLADGSRGGVAQVVAPAATQVLSLAGTAKVGESFSIALTAAGITRSYGHALVAIDNAGAPQTHTLAQIAAALAAVINDDSGGGFTAIADDVKLIITNRQGSSFTAVGTVAPKQRPAGAIEVVRGKDAAGNERVPAIDVRIGHRVSVSFGAVLLAPQAGETWTVTVNLGGVITSRSVVAAAGDNMVTLVARLAGALASGTSFTAQASGTALTIISGSEAVPTLGVTRAPAGGAAGAVVLTTTVKASFNAVTAAPVAGETWAVSVNVGGVITARSYLVAAGDSLVTLLERLAAVLGSGATFTVRAVGATLEITSSAALGPIVSASRAAAGGAQVALPLSLSSATGAPVSGAFWTLRLTVGGSAYTFDYGVSTAQAWESIAAAFAARINTAAAIAGAPLAGLIASATPEGRLVVADIAGRSLAASINLVAVAEAAIDAGAATTTLVNLIGTPLANQLWRLRIADTQDGVARDLRYEVKLGDVVNFVTLATLADFATALAWKLNNDATTTRYTALSDGTRVIIIDRLGKIFETRLQSGAISRSAGSADITLDYPQAEATSAAVALAMRDQLRALYGFNDLEVEAERGTGDLTYTVTFVRDQSGKNKDPIRVVDSAGLVPNPNASVEVVTATLRNGATVNAGINNLQTVSINPNVTGGSFTLAFRIENSSAEFAVFVSAPIAYNASALDVYKALSPILNPDGSTIDIDAAFDFATRTPSKPYTDNFAVRKVGNVFYITFQGAYRNLAIHDIDTRGLTTQESGTVNQHEAPTTTVTLGRTEGEMALDRDIPRASTVNLSGLSGTFHLTISLRGVSSNHVFASGAGSAAQGLAALINRDAADTFTATGDGDVLVIVNRDGGVFKTSLSLNGGNNLGSAVIDRSTPTETAVNLAGKPALGEVWQIKLAEGTSAPTIHSYTVLGNGALATPDSLEAIAQGLAAALNSGANADYAAVAEGATVLIVRRNGTQFAATPAIVAAGQPQAGQTWTVTLDSNTGATTVDLGGLTVNNGALWQLQVSAGGVASVHAITAGNSYLIGTQNVVANSGAHIARILADMVNTNGAALLTAAADGTVLVMVNRAGSGGAFDTGLSVAGVAVSAIDRTSATQVSAILTGVPLAGEQWNFNLSAGGSTSNHAWTVGASDTLADIAAGLADLINLNAAADFAALAEGATLVVVRRDGTLFTATPSVTLSGVTRTPDWGLTLGTLVFSHVAGADETHASVARAVADLINLQGRPEYRASSLDGVLTVENIAGNVFTTAFAVNGALRPDALEAGAAVVVRRIEGINYHEFESLDIKLGSGNDVINVQGTTAATKLDTGAGDDRIYVSSAAAFGLPAAPAAALPAEPLPGFLAGHLHHINGALDIDGGSGRTQLLISGEASTLDQRNGVITDRVTAPGEPANAEIAVRGLTGGANAFGWVDLAQGTITYRTAAANGSFADGIGIWTGFGADTIRVDGSAYRANVRTITSLNTGLGDDTVYLDLDTVEANGSDLSDGLLVLNTQGPWNDLPAITDNDVVVGSGTDPLTALAFLSTAPLIVFGGQGDDTITGGSGNDILFGDRGRMLRFELVGGVPTAVIVEQTGAGGAGDRSDGLVRNPDLVASVDNLVGGNDTIYGREGDNIVVGGAGADQIETASGNDRIAGDNAQFDFWPNSTQVKSAQSTDMLNQPTWGDTIVTGAGNNIVLAGMGDDHVNDPLIPFSAAAVPGSGNDYVIGDNGRFNWDSAGRLESFMSVNAGITRFDVQVGAANPLGVIDVGSGSAPIFADLDGDGDLDALVGNADGRLRYFRNVGSAVTPQYSELTGAANPFNGFDVGNRSTPAVADLDGDGDLDVLVGAADGTLLYFRNTGSASVPVYVDVAANPLAGTNPLAGIDVGNHSSPAVVDLDGDGILDLVVGNADGTLDAYRNNGTVLLPDFVPLAGTADPFAGIDVGTDSAPALADIDGDGDADLLLGESGGTIRYFENSGSSRAPVYMARSGAANPFDTVNVGNLCMPTLADLDRDGDADLVLGEIGGRLAFYLNNSSGAGGNDVILVGDGANIVVGGFGDDSVTAGADADLIFGDNAAVTYTPGTTLLLQAVSTGVTGGAGGNDSIVAGAGDNLIIGGVGSDSVTGGGAVDLVIGDNGQINWTSAGVYSQFRTTDVNLGAGDDIRVGDGDNLVAGGFGADVIETGVDADLILGDNGVFTFTTSVGGVAVLSAARTTDTNAASGGGDVIVAGGARTPVFADVDGDGDFDAVIGANDGTLAYYQNTGSPAQPVYVARVGAGVNPFDGIDVGSNSIAAFADLDGDGDLDLLVGAADGTLGYFENVVPGTVPAYAPRVGPGVNPFDGIDVGDNSAPAFADVNRDGVLDLLVGEADGTLNYFQNSGTGPLAYTLVSGSTSPFDGIDVGSNSLPSFADADGDGDGDLLVGESGGTVRVYAVSGTAAAPEYLFNPGLTNPFANIVVVADSARNIVLAGVGDDLINQPPRAASTDPVNAAGTGQDIVVGDNGYVNFDVSGRLTGFGSAQPELGGNDRIDVGDGNNIVVGGFGNDVITTGAGDDTVLGDNGSVTFTAGTTQLLAATSTDVDNSTGGDDIIRVGEGDNLVVAGVGMDTVIAGSGSDLVIGDSGRIDWTPTGVLSSVVTTNPTLGANDNIRAGDGDNIVAGGFGSDVIETGVGADLILGDNGAFTYTTSPATGNAVLTGAQTTDTTAATGGGDVIVAGGGPAPVFIDVDGDADLDAVVGGLDGTLSYFENTGTALLPVYVERTGAANPFAAIDVGSNSAPALADVDGDGDLDLLVGAADGSLNYYENSAAPGVAPVYGPAPANPFAGIDIGGNSAPALLDLDGDGDLDVVVGAADGTLNYYQNSAAPGAAPVYVLGPTNPFAVIDVGSNAVPTFADVDGDGILDLLVGESGGDVLVYENTGTAGAPTFVANPALVSPYAGVEVGGTDARNIVLAGVGDDSVNQPPRAGSTDPVGVVNGGQDIVIGDNGDVSWDVGGRLTGFGSTQPDIGGNDLINVGNGGNIVVGGNGNDVITTGGGADIVLGDDGRVDYIGQDGDSTDIDSITSTSTNAFGGSDSIVTGGGSDIVIGGRAGDSIDAGNGDNLVIGDSGNIVAGNGNTQQLPGQPITLGVIESIALGDGGDDAITSGSGNDIVLGGSAGDTINTGLGNDSIFGDNGRITYTGPVMTNLLSTDLVAATGGDDVINAGDGNNLIIAGVGNDTVTSGSGVDVVIGDNGSIINNPDGSLSQVLSGDPVLGGDDVITTGEGNDIAVGGAGADIVRTGAGNDILFGDGGEVTITGGGGTVTIGSRDPQYGGDDTLDGGLGNNVVIGGAGTDVIFGNTGRDVILGDNGVVVVIGGIVRTTGGGGSRPLPVVALEETFDGLPGSLAEVEDLPDLIARKDPLLDVALFRKLFSLVGSSTRLVAIDGGVFLVLFGSEAISVPATPSHNEAEAGAVGTPGGAAALTGSGGASLPASAQESPAATAVPANDAVGGLLAALLGAAGIVAVQQPRSCERAMPYAQGFAGTARGAWRHVRRMLRGMLRR